MGCNPFVDKMKAKLDSESPSVAEDSNAQPVSDKMPNKVSPPSNGAPVSDSKGEAKPKSWAELVNENKPATPVCFEYYPMKSSSKVVSPPKDVLLKGNEKLKCSLVGFFSKGFFPLRKSQSLLLLTGGSLVS